MGPGPGLEPGPGLIMIATIAITMIRILLWCIAIVGGWLLVSGA